MSKLEITFTYNGINMTIECTKGQKFKDIYSKFKNKVNAEDKLLYYIYNGSNIRNDELTFNEIANAEDKRRNKMNIEVNELVQDANAEEIYDNLSENHFEDEDYSKIQEERNSLVKKMDEDESNIFQESTIRPKTENINSTVGNGTINNISNQFSNIYYGCSECESLIEILTLDEKNIKFKCNNKIKQHELTLSIKEYMEYINKMKMNERKELNNDVCHIHSQNYYIYCFDCDAHECEECYKNHQEHYNHNKIYLKEIIPDEDKLNVILSWINENNNFIISDEEKENYFVKLVEKIYYLYNIPFFIYIYDNHNHRLHQF